MHVEGDITITSRLNLEADTYLTASPDEPLPEISTPADPRAFDAAEAVLPRVKAGVSSIVAIRPDAEVDLYNTQSDVVVPNVPLGIEKLDSAANQHTRVQQTE